MNIVQSPELHLDTQTQSTLAYGWINFNIKI